MFKNRCYNNIIKMTALILQARLDSSRLPGKALLPLGGEPLLFRVMERLKNLRADAYILASPEDCETAFSPLAERAGFEFVSGPKDDVLERYCIAARCFKAERIIRATGDNPFVNIEAAEAIAAEAEALSADYAAYAGLAYGAGVEALTASALFRAEHEAVLPQQREHVCPYLYENPALFTLHRPLVPQKWRNPALRLTVDTAEDYANAVKRYTFQ